VGWHKYVAIGDSFTEGLDDRYPDGTGYRGWADLVAQRLANEQGSIQYANLAVRGRQLGNIVAEQVPTALAMRPDLVSFAAGGNDVLRRNFDPAALVTEFDETVATLRKLGADVVLFRFADVTKRLPGRRMILPRVEILNRAVDETAERHGARLIDLWHDAEFLNPRLWSVDRLHLSALGHHRVAAHVLTALELTPEPEWLASSPPPDPVGWVAARTADARWATQHLAPWVKRRLTGRSSGDAVSAKRPGLDPLSW
jgi:lysophospholipase L1-like esterase